MTDLEQGVRVEVDDPEYGIPLEGELVDYDEDEVGIWHGGELLWFPREQIREVRD